MSGGIGTGCIGARVMAGKSEWLRRPKTGNGDAVLDHAGMMTDFLELGRLVRFVSSTLVVLKAVSV